MVVPPWQYFLAGSCATRTYGTVSFARTWKGLGCISYIAEGASRPRPEQTTVHYDLLQSNVVSFQMQRHSHSERKSALLLLPVHFSRSTDESDVYSFFRRRTNDFMGS